VHRERDIVGVAHPASPTAASAVNKAVSSVASSARLIGDRHEVDQHLVHPGSLDLRQPRRDLPLSQGRTEMDQIPKNGEGTKD
jgi:hypothetical protein